MTNYREGEMSPIKIDWNNTGQTPEDEFRFIANMIDSYLEQQDKGSEGANQDG